MGFFNENYLNKKRAAISTEINKLQYLVDDSWVDIDVVSKTVEGNAVICIFTLSITEADDKTIEAIRVLSTGNEEIARQPVSIKRTGVKNIFGTLRVPLQEV